MEPAKVQVEVITGEGQALAQAADRQPAAGRGAGYPLLCEGGEGPRGGVLPVVCDQRLSGASSVVRMVERMSAWRWHGHRPKGSSRTKGRSSRRNTGGFYRFSAPSASGASMPRSPGTACGTSATTPGDRLCGLTNESWERHMLKLELAGASRRVVRRARCTGRRLAGGCWCRGRHLPGGLYHCGVGAYAGSMKDGVNFTLVGYGNSHGAARTDKKPIDVRNDRIRVRRSVRIWSRSGAQGFEGRQNHSSEALRATQFEQPWRSR